MTSTEASTPLKRLKVAADKPIRSVRTDEETETFIKFLHEININARFLRGFPSFEVCPLLITSSCCRLLKIQLKFVLVFYHQLWKTLFFITINLSMKLYVLCGVFFSPHNRFFTWLFQMDLALMEEFLKHINVHDSSFCVAVIAIIFNPFFWNVVRSTVDHTVDIVATK